MPRSLLQAAVEEFAADCSGCYIYSSHQDRRSDVLLPSPHAGLPHLDMQHQ